MIKQGPEPSVGWRIATIAFHVLGAVAIAVSSYSIKKIDTLNDKISVLISDVSAIQSNRFTIYDGQKLENSIHSLEIKVANLPPKQHMNEFYNLRNEVDRLKYITGIDRSPEQKQLGR